MPTSRVNDVPFDLARTFERAEELIRRHLKPKHVAAAEKRRSQRRTRNAMRRITRAASVTGASGAGVLGYGLAVGSLGTGGLLAAGAATLIAAGATLFWPARRPGQQKISRTELVDLSLEAEEWLLAQRAILPGRAIPALDTIFLRLHDLQPHIARMEPNGTLAWDLRRLLTGHLPRLIEAYCGLPGSVTSGDPQLLPKLIDGLAKVDEELVRICKEASSDHLLTFEAQREFLENRYGGGIPRP